jgi:hypothetical protein
MLKQGREDPIGDKAIAFARWQIYDGDDANHIPSNPSSEARIAGADPARLDVWNETV